jgi:hypothetical protein
MDTQTQAPTQSQPSPQQSQPAVGQLPAGFTVDSTPQSESANNGLPAGFTIDSTPQSDTPSPTGLQKLTSGLENFHIPSYLPQMGQEASGALKSGAGMVGNILEMLNHGANPDEHVDSPMLQGEKARSQALANSYKQAHPTASPQQVSQYMNDQASKGVSSHIQDAADWLRSSGQPVGFWQHVGSIGEQALELFGLDGISKLADAPLVASEAGKAGQTIDAAAHAAQTSKVAAVLQSNPKIAGLISIGLKASKDAFAQGAQNYAHTRDLGQAAEAALIGGVVSAPIHAAGALASNVAESAEEMAPTTTTIAGQKIPVAATHPEAPEPTTFGGKLIKGAATKEGAKHFVATEVQPAATRAIQNNFSDTAHDAVEALNGVKGDTSATPRPTLDTVDQAANYMKSEAQKTYQKLDEAAKPEIEAWDAKYGNDAPEPPKPVTILGPNGEPINATETGEAIPPRPKSFTELQDQIRGAESTISNPSETQVAREAAIKNMPEYEKEMADFTTKHSDVVSKNELDAANSVYGKGKRFEWVADKIRQATRGSDSGTMFKGDVKSLNPKSLESLPRQYDTKFGEGAFHNLLGSKGLDNYNNIVNTLKNPKTSSQFFEFIKHLPFGIGKAVSLVPGVGPTADKLLFDATAGQRVMNSFRKFQETADAVAKAPGVAVTQVVNQAPTARTKPTWASNAQSSLSK